MRLPPFYIEVRTVQYSIFEPLVVRTQNLTVEKSGALGLVIQQAVNKMVPASGKILTLQDLKVE